MGGTFPLITLLVVAVLGRHVVSANDCFISNCEFAVREECQTSESVICSMRYRPNKQISITAASFPRDVQEIEISDADVITFEPDSIASLTSLQFIKITNVNTLMLLPRSLARGETTAERPIKLTVRKVNNLEIHPKTFAGWRGGSRVAIENVGDCQLFPFSIANAQLRSLDVTDVQSLIFHESAFSEDSTVEDLIMLDIRALSIKTGAFTAKAAVHRMWFLDVEKLTMYSGALSANSAIHQLRFEQVQHLTVETDGIQADIEDLRLDSVTMETCSENAFGSIHGSASVNSVHINRMRKCCMSASKKVKELIIENSRFDQIKTSAIYGRATNVTIKNSIFGTMETEVLQLNVTELYVENSYINEVSQDSFRVHADSAITIRNCTIDTLHKDAFRSLKVKKGSDSAHNRLQLDNLHIKHPQNGSLQFDQNQTVIVHDLKFDIPCACDIVTALGLDASSENKFWMHQPLCVIKGVRPPLGHYLQEFCTEPTTTPPPTTEANLFRGGSPPLQGRPPLPPQTAGESNAHDPQPIPETGAQTSGDGSTHNVALIAPISVVVLTVLTVIAFFVRRQFRKRSRAEGQNGGRRRRTTRH